MPHSCTKCSKVYPDKSQAILLGCSCGSRVFYFIKTYLPAHGTNGSGQASSSRQGVEARQPEQVERVTRGNGNGEKSLIETAIDDVASNATDKAIIIEAGVDEGAVENILVLEPGTYQINVPSLMKGGPVVLRSDAGVYYVRLPERPLPKSGQKVEKGENGKKRRS